MIYNILKQYSSIIKHCNIEKFRQTQNSYELVLTIKFADESELSVNDYLFLDGKRKYSYHYQNQDKELIFRYDNAPHWKELKTYPYHKHLPNNVEESNVMNIEKVLQEISTFLNLH